MDPIETLLAWALPGLIGMLGGLCSLGYPGPVKAKFTIGFFVSKLLAAFFVGKVTGDLAPHDATWRSALILTSGFFAYPVLGVLERRIKDLYERFLPGQP